MQFETFTNTWHLRDKSFPEITDGAQTTDHGPQTILYHFVNPADSHRGTSTVVRALTSQCSC